MSNELVLTLENECSTDVELVWVPEDAAPRRSFLHIPKGETRAQATFFDHRWHCRKVTGDSTEPTESMVELTCGIETHVTVTNRTQHADTGVQLSIGNGTADALALFWMGVTIRIRRRFYLWLSLKLLVHRYKKFGVDQHRSRDQRPERPTRGATKEQCRDF